MTATEGSRSPLDDSELTSIINTMAKLNISLGELEQGPLHHGQLWQDLVARIKNVHLALYEVYPSSLADWLDDFRRDLHPEQEVIWWERLAECYLTYQHKHDLNANQRQAAFKILLSISLGASPGALSVDVAGLPELALEDIQALLREHGL